MSQQIYDPKTGITHEVPDEATPEQVKALMIKQGVMQPDAPEAYHGFGESLVNPINAGRAEAAQGLKNFPHNLVNAAEGILDPNNLIRHPFRRVPEQEHPFAQLFSKDKTNISQQYGTENAGFLGKALQGLSHYGPYGLIPGGAGEGVSAGLAELSPQFAAAVRSGMAQIPGGAAFGFTQSENPIQGAAKEATMAGLGGSVFHQGMDMGNMAGEAIRKGYHALGDVVSSFKPGNQLAHIVDQLGGDISTEANGMRFAKGIRNTYEGLKERYRSIIDPVLEKHGNDKILPAISSGQMTFNARPELFSPDVNRRLNILLENRDLRSAWEVNKQLGKEIGALRKTNKIVPLNGNELNKLDLYSQMYDSIKGGIKTHLSRKGSGGNAALQEVANPNMVNVNVGKNSAAEQWERGSDFYKKKVATFSADPTLRQIALGEIKNPTPEQITSIFKYPEQEIRHVTSSLSPETKNRIILSHVHDTIREPSSFVQAIEDAKRSQGMGRYISQSIEEQMPELAKKIGRKEYLIGTGKNAVPAIVGGALGSLVGAPVKGAMLGTALNAGVPKLAKSLSSIKLNKGR